MATTTRSGSTVKPPATHHPNVKGALLLNERINLVDDPIICKKNGEERSYHPKSPALAFQGGSNRQALHGDVHEIFGAVASVGQQRKDEKEQKRMQRKQRAEMGATRHNPDHNDHGEDKGVDKATRRPKPDGIR